MKLKSISTIPTPAKCLGLFCFFVAFGCSSAPRPEQVPPDTRVTDEAAVQKADMDWSAAAQSKKVDDWVAYYSDDAVVLAPDEAEADSKDTIHKAVGEFLALPGLTVTWKPTKVEAAHSGEVAYVRGTYDESSKNAKGKMISEHGKYVEIWKKQADGGWKCAVDTWNADAPAK